MQTVHHCLLYFSTVHSSLIVFYLSLNLSLTNTHSLANITVRSPILLLSSSLHAAGELIMIHPMFSAVNMTVTKSLALTICNGDNPLLIKKKSRRATGHSPKGGTLIKTTIRVPMIDSWYVFLINAFYCYVTSLIFWRHNRSIDSPELSSPYAFFSHSIFSQPPSSLQLTSNLHRKSTRHTKSSPPKNFAKNLITCADAMMNTLSNMVR